MPLLALRAGECYGIYAAADGLSTAADDGNFPEESMRFIETSLGETIRDLADRVEQGKMRDGLGGNDE